ncbi:MAG: M48 family metalloprotease [Anaerolineales bacterium]|nr:M48 family metalloprotease [Anaerolineales bacterium]
MIEPLIEIDEQRQTRAREYARLRRRLWLVGLLIDGVYITIWLWQGWAIRLRQAFDATGLAWWTVLIGVAFGFAVPLLLISLPLSFYRSFTLPHRYGLSTQTLRGWFTDLVKGGILSLAIGTPLLLALYTTIRLSPTAWWLWAAGGYSLVTVVLTAIAPILLMPIFYKFKPLDENHAELVERLLRLAKRAETRVRGVFTFDMSRRTRTANAALVGIGGSRRILLGDTLIEEFSTDEIETVMAHELGHHVHGDIPLSILVQSAFNFLAFFLAFQGLDLAVSRMNLLGASDPAGLPVLGLLFATLGLITMPFANALSRWRETMADKYALNITNKGRTYASALARLADQNLAEVDPERWVVVLLYSHPPLQSRIAEALQFEERSS